MHFIREKCGKEIFLVADLEELETLDASEIHARRLSAEEIKTPKNCENFIFPIGDGTVKLSGGDHAIRKSTSMRDQHVRGEELSGDPLGSSEKFQPMGEMMGDSKVRNDFWSIEGNYIYRHHLEPRVQLHVPKEESLPYHCDTLT